MGENLTKATITQESIGSPPFILPMSPEEHTIKAPSILRSPVARPASGSAPRLD